MSTKLGTIPLATKVLTTEDIDNVLAEDSNNAIANGIVYSALEEKQNKILKEPESPFPIVGEHVTAVQATYNGFNLSTNAGAENQTPKLLFPVLTADATIITSLDSVGSQTTCYVVYSLDELISVAKNKGDIAIVQKEISTGVTSRTAYFWNGSNWQAMDGNYSADNVYFDEDLALNVSFGKYGSSGSSYTLPSAGKSLKEMLVDAFTASGQHGSKTPPTFSLAIGSYTSTGEVGTTYTIPAATLTMTSLGTYQYGTATCHDVSDNTGISVEIGNAYVESPEKGKTYNAAIMKKSNPVTCAAGTQSRVFGDSPTTYTYNASASYVQGDVPLDSLGAADPRNRLPADTITTSKTATFTGHRLKFWGYRNINTETVLDIDNLTSNDIRNGIHCTAGSTSFPTTITCPIGTKQLFFAAPHDTWKKEIKLLDSLGARLDFDNDNMRAINKVNVEGYNGYTAAPYDIWYLNVPSKFRSEMSYNISWINE